MSMLLWRRPAVSAVLVSVLVVFAYVLPPFRGTVGSYALDKDHVQHRQRNNTVHPVSIAVMSPAKANRNLQLLANEEKSLPEEKAAFLLPIIQSSRGFRKNPNKRSGSTTTSWNRVFVPTLLAHSGFAILAAIQIYAFFIYWNSNHVAAATTTRGGAISPLMVGKVMVYMWQGGEVWRALSGTTAHFDLWHIGLNLSAFYQLSPTVQALYALSPTEFVGLNLSFMVCVTAVWMLWEYGMYRRRLQQDSNASLSSTPTVGYSGVLFALSTMVILRQSNSCPIPLMESLCFPTLSLLGFPWSVAPLVQLGMVQLLLPRVSFAGHLAGIVVGYLYTWGLMPPPWAMYPSIVWPFWHLVYLWGVAPTLTDRGRRLGDGTSVLGKIWSLPDVQIATGVFVFSGFALGLAHPLLWSYALTALFWTQGILSTDSTALTWKRAFGVYAVVLCMTQAITLGSWALIRSDGYTVIGVGALLLQILTLGNGLFRIAGDVVNTEGIFFHTLGRTIFQPLQRVRSIWQAYRHQETTSSGITGSQHDTSVNPLDVPLADQSSSPIMSTVQRFRCAGLFCLVAMLVPISEAFVIQQPAAVTWNVGERFKYAYRGTFVVETRSQDRSCPLVLTANSRGDATEPLSKEGVASMIEKSFVEGVMQLSQGYVETIKLFIAAVLTGYGLSVPLKDLLDLVKACPAQSANRPLMTEEEELRSTWITLIYLIAQNVKYREAVVTDANLLADSDIVKDNSEVWTAYNNILPRLREQHGEGNETGPRFNADKVIENNSDQLAPLIKDSYRKALVLQDLRVAWITLTVLEEEKLCLSDQDPPAPPIPNELGPSQTETPLIPSSPEEQQRRAIRSISDALKADATTKPPRLYVDFLIPLPPETKEEDIDPWPGGLAQMYPYAEEILQQILKGIVDNPAGPASSQVISKEDCCGFLVQESATTPKNDVAAILFPGVDQLDKIEEIDQMVGSRTLILFNRQFKLPVDFGFADKERAKKLVFDKFRWGFAFQELACRGEDVKLTFEHPSWNSCVVCSEDLDAGVQEVALLDPQSERPTYEALEKRINEVLPEPLWMRKMGEAERKGLKFQRGTSAPSSSSEPLITGKKDENESLSAPPRYQLLDVRLAFRGPVDQGYGRGGKKLGFPTANLPSSLFQNALEDIQNGVYFGWALIEGRNNNEPYKAIVNVGLSPTFEGAENPEKIIEAHLSVPDDEEPLADFYGETMRLQLDAFMRPERKFPSFPELMAQITADVQDASAALDTEPYASFQKASFLTEVNDDKPWTGSGGGDTQASWETVQR